MAGLMMRREWMYLRAHPEPITAQSLREYRYLGVFSLAGLSFFTSIVHLGFTLAVITASAVMDNKIKPNPITQSVNVWAPDLQNAEIMFPASRSIAVGVSVSDACDPFTPHTIPFQGQNTTIFPKLLLVGHVDNRVSMGVFFFLSFAFQFFSVVEIGDLLRYFAHGEHPTEWLGEALYQNLANGRVSKAHFVEYSFSATLMVLVMVTQVGVTDLATLLSLCINTWACMIIGLLAEYIVDAEETGDARNPTTVCGVRQSLVAHVLGWVPLIPVMFAMLAPLLTYQNCIKGTVSFPLAVWIFVGGEIALFCLFGLVQLKSIIAVERIRKTPAAQFDEKQKQRNLVAENACAAEAHYVLLSLTAKAFLALTIYMGIYAQPG